MILIALAAAVQVPQTWNSAWGALDAYRESVKSPCKAGDIPCLDHEVIRLEKRDAELKAEDAKRVRIARACGNWDLLNPTAPTSAGWTELKAAKSRACRARMKAEDR